MKLSEVIEKLHQDDDLSKLAADHAGAGAAAKETATESPVSESVGDTVEDEKATVTTKMMELAGLQEEATSAAKPDETLNTSQKAPAGEKAVAPGVSPAASAAAPEEMATVVASVLEKMDDETRKVASIAILQKIASFNVLKAEDVPTAGEKTAEEKFAEYDAIGRIMARAYHDETQKIAGEVIASEDVEPSKETTKEASSHKGGDITESDIALLKALKVA